MSISMEEALLSWKKQRIADSTVGSGDKEPCVKMTLSLFHRRKTMLITNYMGRLNPTSLQHLADQFNTTVDTLQRDWERRSTWEPFIWESEQANDDGKDLLKLLQLAREAALELMNSPRLGGNARVGAIARYTEAIKTEIELKQSLGLLRKQIQPAVMIQQNVTNTTTNIEQTTTLLAQYEQVLREITADQLGRLQQNGSGKPLDQTQTSNNS